VRTYVVQPGDSPGSIAASFAGCPKCSRDLIGANTSKPTVTHPNGFVTFKELRAGEKLALPDKWFDPAFDLLPPAYFASLPYADGVTPSPFGELAAVILRDFRALEVAADKVHNANDAVAAIVAAVQPALDSSNAAAKKYARAAVQWTKVSDQRALASALSNAQWALKELYGSMQPPEEHHD